jgi:hypothetical protein
MKIQLALIAVVAGAMLAATPKAGARPPRQHVVVGVIQAINFETHTITLAPAKDDQSLDFVWKDSTRFTQGWSRICLGAFEPGQTVKIYYRKEVGQLVPRSVSLRTGTATCCTTGRCGANPFRHHGSLSTYER